MNLNTLREEAWRNCHTGTAHAIILMATALAITLTLGAADATAVTSLDQQAREYVAKGGSVTILEADGRIDAQLCTALASQPGVKNVGLLRKRPPSRLLNLPGRNLPTYDSSANLINILRQGKPGNTDAGVTISREAADLLGVTNVPAHGSYPAIRTDNGTAAIVNIYDYPQDGRMRGLGFAMLTPVAATGTFDQCWVEQWPATAEMQRAIRGVLSPHVPPNSQDKITVFPWNGSLGENTPAVAGFRERVTRWAPPAAGTLTGVIAFAAIRRRKLELAANLHLGQRRLHAYITALIEVLIWLTPTLVIGCCAAFVYAGFQPTQDYVVNALRNSLTPVTAFVCGVSGTVAAVASIAERHLFNYFKDR